MKRKVAPPKEIEPAFEENSGARQWPLMESVPNRSRLQILYDLCSFHLFEIENFETILPTVNDQGKRLDQTSWRISPIGVDKQQTEYWLLADCWLFLSHMKSRKSDDDESEAWKCVCFDKDSWDTFLGTCDLVNSRKVEDKKLLAALKKEAYPSALPIIEEHDRKIRAWMKKQELEMRAAALIATRKRSARIQANERIKQDIEKEEEETRREKLSRRNVEEPLYRPSAREETSMAKPAPQMSREERRELLNKRRDEVEQQKILDEIEKEFGTNQVEESLDVEALDEVAPHRRHQNVVVPQPVSPLKITLKMGSKTPIPTESPHESIEDRILKIEMDYLAKIDREREASEYDSTSDITQSSELGQSTSVSSGNPIHPTASIQPIYAISFVGSSQDNLSTTSASSQRSLPLSFPSLELPCTPEDDSEFTSPAPLPFLPPGQNLPDVQDEVIALKKLLESHGDSTEDTGIR